jgi:hypothetical protein
MKQIPKKQFDKVLRISREIWETGEENLFKMRIKEAQKIERVTGLDWMAILDFIDCIIRSSGFIPGASDEIIHFLLRVFGWEVAEDVEP